MDVEVIRGPSGVTFIAKLMFQEYGFTADAVRMIAKDTMKVVKTFKFEHLNFERDNIYLKYDIEYDTRWPEWYAISAYLLTMEEQCQK